MRRIDDYITENKFENKIHLILQIHDEVIYEVADDLIKDIPGKLIGIMESVLPKDKIAGVPILANFETGQNWGDMS